MSYFDRCKVRFLNISAEDLSDEDYFKRDGISNSSLKRINPKEGGSPQLFINPPKSEYSTSLELGSAVHQLILQPKDYELSDYSGKPSGKCGVFIDYIFKNRSKGMSIYESIETASRQADYYQDSFKADWHDKHIIPKRIKSALKSGMDYYLRKLNNEFVAFNKEVIVLPQAQLETCKRCLRSFKNNVGIQHILQDNIFDPKQYLNEIALFSDIEVLLPDGHLVPLKIKGKFDSVVLDPETKTAYLNDIKTTSKQLEYFMGTTLINDDGIEEVYNGVFEYHHYFRQLAVYSLMLQMYLDHCLYKADYNIKCNIFAIETTGDNRSQMFRINNSYIQYGIQEFKELICRVAYHEIYGYDAEPL